MSRMCVYFLLARSIQFSPIPTTEKQKRLKQAKEQAQEEVEKYRQERERQFKEFENKVMPITINVPSSAI